MNMKTDSAKTVQALELQSAKTALNILRAVKASGHGHIGGALSALDVVTALYFYKMNVNPQNPDMPDRDRFILSAGHKCLVQYAALAEKGFFEKEKLDTYGQLHSKLPGHPDMHKLPGIEANTGALGHGLSIGAGMAIANKLEKRDAQVYVVMGDGELPEGSNWEAAAAAAKYGLDNLVVVVDNNGLQISGRTEDVMNTAPIGERFAAFGWCARDINGHDMTEIVDTLDSLPFEAGKPSVIVAHTIKSKGLSFAENDKAFHYWKTNPEQLAQAEKEFEEKVKALIMQNGGAA